MPFIDAEVIQNIEINQKKSVVGADPWKSLAQSRAGFKGSSGCSWLYLVEFEYAQEGEFGTLVLGLTTLVAKSCFFPGAQSEFLLLQLVLSLLVLSRCLEEFGSILSLTPQRC